MNKNTHKPIRLAHELFSFRPSQVGGLLADARRRLAQIAAVITLNAGLTDKVLDHKLAEIQDITEKARTVLLSVVDHTAGARKALAPQEQKHFR